MMVDSSATSGKKRSSLLAGVLSLIVPGLGQIYAGALRRGLTLLIGLPVQAALFYGVGLNWLAYCVGLVWLWNVLDAFMLARKREISVLAPVLLILVMNVVAAAKVTDVHVPNLQGQQRMVMGQVVNGIAKPDLATRNTTTQTANAVFEVPGQGSTPSTEAAPSDSSKPSIAVSPAIAPAGTTIEVTGRRFAPNSPGTLVLLSSDERVIGKFRSDARGSFRTSFVNPRDIPGRYYLQARMQIAGKGFVMSEALRTAAPRMLETIYLALLGTGLSLLLAIPLSFFGARNIMSGSPVLRLIYGLTRTLFSVLRSVEVLIIAVIAVAAVGIGPFAGVIALAIHGVGALGKLYSESIESIEHGPIEAIRSTGANEFQVVLYGVVPQVVPQFIAFTLYRWDINVRMATVIGLVGGGGIGYQLVQYMNLSQWPQTGTAIWMIAGVVMLMDYASAVIREKVV